jgi:hypothetical protein
VRIAYIDHAVTIVPRNVDGDAMFGRVDFSPGLVDLEIYPELAPHSYGGTLRHDPPIFELQRCCTACEDAWKIEAHG